MNGNAPWPQIFFPSYQTTGLTTAEQVSDLPLSRSQYPLHAVQQLVSIQPPGLPGIFEGDSSQELLSPKSGQTVQDRVRVLDRLWASTNKVQPKTLEQLIRGGHQQNALFTNGIISYAMDDFQISVPQYALYPNGDIGTSRPISLYARANTWVANNTWQRGRCLFSLAMYMLGTDSEHARAWVAQEVSVPYHGCDVPQLQTQSFGPFIAWPNRYSNVPPHPHWLLGVPNHLWWFSTEHGEPSFALAAWKVGLQTVQMFCSLVWDAAAQMAVWRYARPPAEALLFNRHRISQEPAAPVFITEDLGWALHHQASTEYIATWAGGRELVGQIDWRPLAGRNVMYLADRSEDDSYIVGTELRQIFHGLGSELRLLTNG